MHDPFNLHRFVEAQRPVYARVLEELQRGRKSSHWMWFVFPQLHGLGHSEMAERYALSGAAEAQAYLLHPLLGPQLEECVSALLAHRDKTALEILGHPDDLKLRSCLTLFASIAPEHPLFAPALEHFFAADADAKTLFLLGE
ncbi:DUF1810 domain-containing protein [Pseudomonas sp. HR96]|uniref:DUF1810 domain-containing protein n=1 Tax=Pseudomonas sp. HR96 TaxID=1027966 RepID=UPI002A7667D6|nr:DUF1810 domain-containing protein [Pseudomonas sp. HR96]WPP01570.1 DUF1810 domain-containing protein [Pseudomonas sp. HR96]